MFPSSAWPRGLLSFCQLASAACGVAALHMKGGEMTLMMAIAAFLVCICSHKSHASRYAVHACAGRVGSLFHALQPALLLTFPCTLPLLVCLRSCIRALAALTPT